MYNQKMKCGAEKSAITCWRLLRSHHNCSPLSAEEHTPHRVLRCLISKVKGEFYFFFSPSIRVGLYCQNNQIKVVYRRKHPRSTLGILHADRKGQRLVLYSELRCSFHSHLSQSASLVHCTKAYSVRPFPQISEIILKDLHV